MLQHARGNDFRKLHTFKVPLCHESVNDTSHGEDTAAWCESNIKALETNLKKGITEITAIPIDSGVYLICPQTREELRVIKGYYNAKVFEIKDARYKQLESVQNAVRIYRASERPWRKWMDDVEDKLASLGAKSYDQHAIHELADGSLSESFVAVWIEWDLKALAMADKTKRTGLEEFLLKNGVTDAALLIRSLKYDLCEILVKENREVEIKQLFTGKVYAAFDKKSALVSSCGYRESLRIVLTSYENLTETWAGQEVLVKNRIKQLEDLMKESRASKIWIRCHSFFLCIQSFFRCLNWDPLSK